MTASRRGDYDRSVLPITVPERHIPLTAIRDAATAVYAAAISHAARPRRAAGQRRGRGHRALPEARSPAAHRVVQNTRRLQHGPPVDSRRAAGRRVDRQRRQRGPGRGVGGAKVGARCSVMVMDTAPDAKIRAIERLGATIVRATYDECWRTVESHRIRPHARAFRAPVRRRSLHRGQRHGGPRDPRGSARCRRDRRATRRRRAARRYSCSRARTET